MSFDTMGGSRVLNHASQSHFYAAPRSAPRLANSTRNGRPSVRSTAFRSGLLALWLSLGMGMVGCGSDNPTNPSPNVPETDDTVLVSGTFEPQDGMLSQGRACIVEDTIGARLLTLSEDFRTELSAGTVHVYLAKSDGNLAEQRAADPSNISPMVGRVNEDGAHRFPLTEEIRPELYPYVILWCEPEAINFAACHLTERP